MLTYLDLHLHSRYAYATSRYAELPQLSAWAQRKGIGLMATGDFTHPRWMADLKDKLVPAGGDLFRLRPDLETAVAQEVPASCRAPVRFLLGVEVSLVYNQGGRNRKMHHLIFVPSIEAAERLTVRLAEYGDLTQDGRPTLMLDSRLLLAIVLETDPRAYLIPAHIWTPWFGMLGSKTGFDSLEECFGDLTPQIFAAETGLSADAAMCRRVGFLDHVRLVSFSDAHGPQKLGRELTLLDLELSYDAVRRAFETGEGYEGTVEFFPEEGKYHLDGHRSCNVRFTPAETKAHGGRCPVCKRKLTVGVLHRVEDLASRAVPVGLTPNEHMIPLVEILAEIEQVGEGSKRVQTSYQSLLEHLGPELAILRDAPLELVARQHARLAEALGRLREGRVIAEPGYDGVFGKIKLFTEAELPAKKSKRGV